MIWDLNNSLNYKTITNQENQAICFDINEDQKLIVMGLYNK